MKRVVAILAAVGLLAAIAAGPASPATPTDKKIAALEKKVATQGKQIKALQKQVTEARDLGRANVVLSACLTAVTADAFQNSWAVINQVAGRSVFGAALTLSDEGTCNALRVARQPTQVPPTMSPFTALLGLFRGSTIPDAIARLVERLH